MLQRIIVKSVVACLIATFFALLVLGCGLAKGKEQAARAVDTFHQQMNAAQFAEIYRAASPELQKTTTEADFTRLMETIHRKLGNFKTAREVGSRAISGSSGTTVTLTEESEFEHGSGTETFVFSVSDASATLVRYKISSQDLILK